MLMKRIWKMPSLFICLRSSLDAFSRIPVRFPFVAILLGVSLCLIGPVSQAAGVNFVEVQTDGAGNQVDGLASVSGVAVSPYGKFVYGAGTSDDGIAVFSLSRVRAARGVARRVQREVHV